MILRSGWIRAPVYPDGKEGGPTGDPVEKRVQVEIDLGSCRFVSTESVRALLRGSGISTRRTIDYSAMNTRPLSRNGQRLNATVSWPIPVAAFVQAHLENAARRFVVSADFRRPRPKRDAAVALKLRKSLSTAAHLFDIPDFFYLSRREAPMAWGFWNAQTPELQREGERLFEPLAKRKNSRRQRSGVHYTSDVVCLREALALLVRYADRAAEIARKEAASSQASELRNEGDPRLNEFVRRVCFLWRDDLGLPISTSVTNGKAAGPLVRFVRGAMEAINVHKTEDATRALIRRNMAERAIDAEHFDDMVKTDSKKD